jgi:response regulator RpfG family c-di-GMP phosphodiesterase
MSKPKILLVDDEANVLRALQRVLRREPFEVVATTFPEEAIQKVSEETFSVVVSDQRMPQMEGVQVLEKVREISPDTVRIMLTGYADIQAAVDAINRGAVFRFLAKPWDEEGFRSVIRDAVSYYELVAENKRLHTLTQKQNVELKDLNENLEKKVVERTQEISRLNRQLEKSFMGSVQVLAELAELHSTVIGSHAKRVAGLAKAIAQEMGLSDRALFEIEVGAALHDIGKVGVPEDILTQPQETLSRRALEVLRSHVTKGEAIVRMVPNLGEADIFVRHHHEHFDGTGYPDRLRSRDIPLGARIIAAADAYDKVLNARTHFESATPEQALGFVRRHCPGWFDPEVVAALVTCIEEERISTEASEVEVRIRDMKQGMILSRDLKTARGVLLLPENQEIREQHLTRIRNYQETDPVVDAVYVYRKQSPQPAPEEKVGVP